ncbi:MAG TPA: D-2-hydroxyacid dehydrogenase [Geobacteraceae bacterium]|nr:D-2-hydroxyacid dehydrogenase [Geobacteraceae bacterium]
MEIKDLLINLHNEVDAFCLKERHLEMIREAFPGIRIVAVSSREDFLARLPDAEWVITWIFKSDWYRMAPGLKAVFTPAAGHDWAHPDPTGRVRNFYGRFHGRIMRESLLAMILFFNRRLGRMLENRPNKIWDRHDYDGAVSLFSQHVLIVGYGSVGRQMAEILRGFGATVTGVKRDIRGFEHDPFAARVVTFDSLPEELPLADHVVLVLPGEADTEGIFTASHFAMMKKGSHFYNLGRGNCYREEDLVNALRNGPLAGAGLDVFATEPLPSSSQLWELSNVIITPHASAIGREYLDLYFRDWIEDVRGMP